MTSDVRYPSSLPANQTHRCKAIDKRGQRCKMLADRDRDRDDERQRGRAAAWWLERNEKGQARPWRPHIDRWDDGGRSWEDDRGLLLRWCVLFAR